MFYKTLQNIVQMMHITIGIAHSYQQELIITLLSLRYYEVSFRCPTDWGS